MLLAIDVGNTHTVLGCFWSAGQRDPKGPSLSLKKTWRLSTHPICTADEFRTKLYTLLKLEGLDIKAFSATVVSSVVPSFTAMLRNAFRDQAISFLDHTSPFSFRIKADPPGQVGADRLVNSEAAIRIYGAPAIIIDSGTATTLCAISAEQEYLGGAIMPGIELSIETLAKNTAKLFAVELVPPERAIGGSTQEALRSGILLGYASMIDGMVERFKKELKPLEPMVVATGGISQLLKGLTTQINHFDADLTLKGIAFLYDSIRSR
ncbi:MAG: type III pantothenate kinase [Bdellovibrionota bacterium]